jgi:hypothetical protein
VLVPRRIERGWRALVVHVVHVVHVVVVADPADDERRPALLLVVVLERARIERDRRVLVVVVDDDACVRTRDARGAPCPFLLPPFFFSFPFLPPPSPPPSFVRYVIFLTSQAAGDPTFSIQLRKCT